MNAAVASVTDKSCREAAVLALLYPDDEGPALVLTVRPQHMASHAGQISFPGGRREPGETNVETALREAHEEIGLAPDSVEVLGQLTPLYIPPSNYCVYPVVGATGTRPSLFPADGEVAAILHVPVSRILDPTCRVVRNRQIRGAAIEAPCFHIPPHEIWGATAMMLAELLLVLVTLDRSDF